MFGHLWRAWTNSWQSPRRARWLYLVLAAGFVALAIGGGIKGDALVTTLAAIAGAATAGLAVLAPKLAMLFAPPLPRAGQDTEVE